MGFHGISLGSLIVIGLIAVLLFGPKRLRRMAEDLGIALRNFNKALHLQEDLPTQKEAKTEKLNSDSNSL
jgi:TatA/E family protein of Tat protein translocase